MSLRVLLPLLAFSLTACPGPTPPADGGTGGGSGDGGLFVDFQAPATAAVPNSFLVTVNGEDTTTEGFGFPPGGGGEPYFVDGWELTFEHVLVTVGNVTLSENPDLNPNDPSQVGTLVAEAAGPWAVDLAKEGPVEGKEQVGKAWPLVRLANQNKKTGAPAFDATAKYALGYSLLAATTGVQNVNLDAAAQAAYAQMVAQGYSVWLKGTATWKGDQGTPACRSTVSGYDFGRVTKVVNFDFGFKAPVHFKNCENPELQPTGSRGVQSSTNAETVSQLTFHLDHPFWESLEEDAPLRFDALAASQSAAVAPAPASITLTTSDLAVGFEAFKDAQQTPVPWRTCGPVESNERTSGTVAYDPVSVPVNPAGGAAGLKDLLDYMTYNLSTMGHLNNDGLCFPDRQYPSPR